MPGVLAWYRNKLHSSVFAGMVLGAGAIIALIWANSPWRDFYADLSSFTFGPGALGLHLPLGTWVADGLLAIFFFVVGLELKAEFVAGSLRDRKQALVPIICAVFGMVGPILLYTLIITLTGAGVWDGWAIPVATDIAFALAVLGLFGTGLPVAARTFLLTLAVVDDLLGIIIIAVYFATDLNFLWLFVSLGIVAIFGFLLHKRIIHWWLLWPLGLLAWGFMQASGVHATIAGVALGLTAPATPAAGEQVPLTEEIGTRFEPWSAGLVLPVFSFFAAGVNVVDMGGVVALLTHPVAIAIYVALPVGKCLGIWGGAVLLTRFTPLRLGKNIVLPDIFAISLVAGIGFTVSLLIASLSFDPASELSAYARVAVIVGSVLAMVLGAIALKVRGNARVSSTGTGSSPHDSRLDGAPNPPTIDDDPHIDGRPNPTE